MGLCVVGTASAEAQTPQPSSYLDGLSTEVAKIFDAASPSIVRIQTATRTGTLSGSGFFVDDKGTILTALPVVGDATFATVQVGEQKHQAIVVGTDARSGVAILSTKLKSTPALKFGNSDDIKMASSVVGIGYPFELSASPNFGTVSGFDIQFAEYYFATTHIRVNISISPGQIGGPLLNSKGEAIGMMVVAMNNGCYALPINAAKYIIPSIQKFGEARHAWVGIGVVENRNPQGEINALSVSTLFEGTPALASGIRQGDQVTKINGRPIRKASDVLDASFFSHVGDKIPVEVIRNGKPMSFEFVLTERPANSHPVSIPVQGDSPSERPQTMQVKGSR